MEHEHDWKPIPLCRGKYGCWCSATGWRRLADGVILEHKKPLVNDDLLGELAVTVRQTCRQLLALPSYENPGAPTTPWSWGYRRTPLPNADAQIRPASTNDG